MQFANIGHLQLYVAAVVMGGLPLSPHTDQKFPADNGRARAAWFTSVTSRVTLKVLLPLNHAKARDFSL
jgi:hypothetical protein